MPRFIDDDESDVQFQQYVRGLLIYLRRENNSRAAAILAGCLLANQPSATKEETKFLEKHGFISSGLFGPHGRDDPTYDTYCRLRWKAFTALELGRLYNTGHVKRLRRWLKITRRPIDDLVLNDGSDRAAIHR